MEDPEQLSTEEKDDYSEGDEVDLVAEVRLTTQVTKQDVSRSPNCQRKLIRLTALLLVYQDKTWKRSVLPALLVGPQ